MTTDHENGTNGKALGTDLTRPRAREWKPKFIKAMSDSPSVTRACDIAGVTRSMAYHSRGHDPKFAEAWDNALQSSMDKLEHDAYERARTTSDQLAMFFLKAHRPMYREITRTEVTGADGGAVLLAAVVNERDRLADLITEETPALEAPGADSGDAAAGGGGDQPPQGEG